MEVNKNENISSFFDSLDEWLNDENRIITYRCVSVTFSLHVNYAKHVLEEFTKSQRDKNRSLYVTYCLAGCLASDENKVYKVVVVPEELKEETKAAMLPPVSCHIYSVQNCKLKTADMLYTADFDLLKSAGFDANRFSAVHCPSARIASRTATETGAASVSNSSTTSQTASKSALTASSSTAVNQSKSGEVKKSTEKTTQSKTSAGFGRLFGNAAKKQPSTEDKKTSSADTARSSEVGQTVSGSSEISKNVVSSIPKSDTSNRSHSTANDAVSSKTDSVLRTKVADVSKTASKQSVQMKNKNESSKRRRIVSISSSDEEDADVVEPSSPELIVPSPPAPAAVEAEPVEVDMVPAAADDSAEPQRMQRKLISKTYVNEEGYMVTEKVWQNEMVPVSTSEEVSNKPVVKPSTAQPQPKKQPAKKTPPQNSRTKQASLTSFFQKK